MIVKESEMTMRISEMTYKIILNHHEKVLSDLLKNFNLKPFWKSERSSVEVETSCRVNLLRRSSSFLVFDRRARVFRNI